MRIISKRGVKRIDAHLEMTKIHLLGCIKEMEGKYGTSEAVSNLKCAMIYVKQCISDNKYDMEFYQQFRNPPNTPKSRRLGWHKEGETNEQ